MLLDSQKGTIFATKMNLECMPHVVMSVYLHRDGRESCSKGKSRFKYIF